MKCPCHQQQEFTAHLHRHLPLQIEAERAAVLAEERSNIERLLTAISATLNQELPAKLAEAVRGEVADVAAGVAAAVAPAVQQAVAATLSTVGGCC